MARIAIIFVLLITVNAILGTEPTELFQHGSKIVSTHNYYRFTSETYWISGHKNGRSSWLWINGDFIIYSDWGAGEPSDSETDKCLSINNGNWYDRRCDTETGTGFICEERETFEEIEQRSIYQVTPVMTYWTSAHTIGRSTWLWINGEIINYADWATGQPMNPAQHSCMFIYRGDWYNNNCNNAHRAFICESRQLVSTRLTGYNYIDIQSHKRTDAVPQILLRYKG
ncbi:hypothetical protein B566_EDAN017461, partial [Ephemera danica]